MHILNSRILHLPVALILATLAVRSSPAQEADKIPPPTFPLKLRAPDKASWTVQIKRNSGGGDDGESGSRKITVTKTAPIYHETETGGGSGAERWAFLTPGSTYRFTKGPSGWERLYADYYADIAQYETSDFEDTEWATQETYKGVVVTNGVPLYYFEKTSSKPISRRDLKFYDVGAAVSGQGAPTFTCRAWIDPKTLLPVKLEDGREVRTFTYNDPPAAQLMPPSEVLSELKKWVAEIQRMNR
jgi:hypothetical protein